MPDNNYNSAFDALVDFTNKLNNQAKLTVFDIANLRKDFEDVLRNFPVTEVKELKDVFGKETGEFLGVLNKVIDQSEKTLQEYSDLTNKIKETKKDIDILNNLLSNANDSERNIIERRKEEKEKELNDLEQQNTAYKENKIRQLQIEKEIEQEYIEFKKEQKEKEKEAEEKLKQQRDKTIDSIFSVIDTLSSSVVNLLENSVSKVVDVYEQNAGNLAAALNQSVGDINNLQRKIANTLQDESLSQAISNVAVLNETVSLVNSGYTNTDKLQENATSIAIGREIAPNLNFDTATVKNLTNIFGSDFIDRFSAIQAAVQDTAGSTINISEDLSSLMKDLEPVYQNAQYQMNALQDTSDIEATLSSAIDSGVITSSQRDEYLNMITELMDPSKAFSSKDTAVRVAATTYDFGSGSPLEALEAILNARRQMYSSIDSSNSYMGNISRSLVANVYGDDTMSATYNPSGLYGLDILHTEDLSTTYENRLSKLESGDLTTQKEREANILENSSFVQGLATIQKYAPLLYSVVGTTIVSQLQSLPRRIADALKSTNIGLNNTNKTNIDNDIDTDTTDTKNKTKQNHTIITNNNADDIVDDNTQIAQSNNTVVGTTNQQQNQTKQKQGLVSRARNTTLGQSIANNSFFSGSGTKLGVATSGFSQSMYTLGASGAINLIGQMDISDGGLTAKDWGFNGDYGAAVGSYASMGAGIGALIGSLAGPVGNVVGAGIGTLIGALAGLATATAAANELEEEANKLRQDQIQQTKDLLGEGVTAVDSLEAKAEIARGGGIAHLSSGDYEIDYKPSTYAGFASGLDYVPYDNFVARLHKGEAVVTKEAADSYRQQNPNFYNSPLMMNNDYDIVGTLNNQTESIVNALNKDNNLQPLSTNGTRSYKIINANI